MKKIKLGEPQPEPCEKCGMAGYQVFDTIKTHYGFVFSPDGKYELSFLSEAIDTLHQGKTPECSNCGGKLKFKVLRDSKEEI